MPETLIDRINPKRARHDLNNVVDWVLLLATAATIVTGFVVHLWGLHGFVWHTWAGYVMTAAVLVHLAFNYRSMHLYAAGRLGRMRRDPARQDSPPRRRAPSPPPRTAGETTRRVLVSRRGAVGVALGGAAGYVVGAGAGGLGLRPGPQVERGADLGMVYHRWSSSPGLVDAVGALGNFGRQPARFKTYADRPAQPLPAPDLSGGLSAEEAIRRRRSVRTYASRPLSQGELSRLLLLTSGETPDGRRHYPSSGALYPVETYLAVHNVDGLERGLYHYDVQDHRLRLLRRGDLRSTVVRHGLRQEFLGTCGVVLYLTLVPQRLRFRYGERSYRYGLIELGHLGQNAYLAATSMGLGACAVGAYDDAAIDRLLGVDGVEETSVYLLSVGHV